MMTLGQAHHFLPGSALLGDPATPLLRVHTDSRSLQAGDLFVALKGERFDAHDFLPEARKAGAAAMAERGLAQAGLAGLQVSSAQQALVQLAAAWRAQFTLPLVAVTGSNGKTTVTQMLASILRVWQREAALATQGNLNNHIGVPLTLLRLRAQHRAAVVELGMNHPGEIAQLAAMAKPSVALVNNAQREHLEFMATVAAVAEENGAVISALPHEGVAVFPADDHFTPRWRQLALARMTLTFALGQGAAADVCGTGVWHQGAWQVAAHSPLGELHFTLRVAGQHNVKNALAAAACAIAAGAPSTAICAGLSGFEPVKGRSRALQLQVHGRALTLVDDSYNANPDSVQAAIDVLAALPGPQLLVLGDMGEVGDQGAQFHAEAGAYAHAQHIDALYALGPLGANSAAQFTGAQHFADMSGLIAAVLAHLPRAASVLVKGSRFMRMEQVVEAITAAADPEKPRESPLAH
ncbi:MAG: UDP-N-acetylmuramoyl-tripeptide--D-alanyl-D-alanine ligase [Burkholderiaceae bacterium]